MALLYDIESYAHHGKDILALQDRQRDFSPFVVHFTAQGAMRDVLEYLKFNYSNIDNKDPLNVNSILKSLESADKESFTVFEKIASSSYLKLSSDKAKKVSLSECTLPGLLSLSARYGRFGLMFTKQFIFEKGGRPAAYVDKEIRTKLYADSGKESKPEVLETEYYQKTVKNFLRFTNVYDPAHYGYKFQDYTHEREWILLEQLKFEPRDIAAILVPSTDWVGKVIELEDGKYSKIPILPLFQLYQLGA
ncbi:hypothetical protein K8R78_05985 [bacterium]|nr:hypothetical protein [bacterium]